MKYQIHKPTEDVISTIVMEDGQLRETRLILEIEFLGPESDSD